MFAMMIARLVGRLRSGEDDEHYVVREREGMYGLQMFNPPRQPDQGINGLHVWCSLYLRLM